MTNNDLNPWLNMQESTQRRVSAGTERDLFWIKDYFGKYGFYIKKQSIFENFKSGIKLHGIEVIKRNSDQEYGELFLILNNNDDWELFKKLCDDLIGVALESITEDAMMSTVELRLKRWQQLLKQERQELTLEKQMGLFSELLCLSEIIYPMYGISSAILFWVGPEQDKQDFMLNNSAIEVKSYRTSKGPSISISSLNQLYSEKNNIYLISYGLTLSDNGKSIDDIVKTIMKLIDDLPDEVSIMFDKKLIEYGFIPELTKDSLYKFIVDANKIFDVSDDFPRINPHNVNSSISMVRYSIDLSQCIDFETKLEDIYITEGCS
jgi:hypothetical protein